MAARRSLATPTEKLFLEWLEANGASFPKIQWPVATPNGLRGATAREAIAPREVMVSIPQRLMISEQMCWADAALRRVYKENRDLFCRDDPVLALFLVRELARGDQSFYAPYLRILPEVETVQDWTEDELSELRDPSLVEAAARRTTEIKAMYSKIMRRLEEKYPGEFPAAEFTFARFRFAWKSIQARTFGRRLPWTALVPFADCLNHANVATQYDFNVDANGTFRLFLSGATSYGAGCEVFNSYGRRPNFQLLLDYGFALENNEWDFVDVELPRDTACRIGRRFPFRKRLRVESETTLDTLFPVAVFPHECASSDPNAPARTAQLGQVDTVAPSIMGELQSRRDVLLWFRNVLVGAIERFGTTLEHDKVRLTDERLSERLRMALQYRCGRLRLLDRLRRELEEALGDNESHEGHVREVTSVMESLHLRSSSN